MSIFVRCGECPRLVELEPCGGMREVEGWPRPCPAGCVAHFDAWADPRRHYDRTGATYSPFPNSVLSWVQHLPGSVSGANWTAADHECFADAEVSVRSYHNDTLFCRADGEPVPVWVVILDGETELGHHAALFENADEARSFYQREIAWYEDDCTCPG